PLRLPKASLGRPRWACHEVARGGGSLRAASAATTGTEQHEALDTATLGGHLERVLARPVPTVPEIHPSVGVPRLAGALSHAAVRRARGRGRMRRALGWALSMGCSAHACAGSARRATGCAEGWDCELVDCAQEGAPDLCPCSCGPAVATTGGTAATSWTGWTASTAPAAGDFSSWQCAEPWWCALIDCGADVSYLWQCCDSCSTRTLSMSSTATQTVTTSTSTPHTLTFSSSSDTATTTATDTSATVSRTSTRTSTSSSATITTTSASIATVSATSASTATVTATPIWSVSTSASIRDAVLLAVAVCGCTAGCVGVGVSICMLCPRKGEKSVNKSFDADSDRRDGVPIHATAPGIDVQCGSHAATNAEVCREFNCGANLVEILSRREEKPEIPQPLPRPTSFLASEPPQRPAAAPPRDADPDFWTSAHTPSEATQRERPQPPCSECGGRMAWSCRRDGPYHQGWHCDNFAECGSSGARDGAYRWHCSACCADLCRGCARGPAPRGPLPPPGAVALAAAADDGQGALLPSLGLAALDALDTLLAAVEAPRCHVQPSRPAPDVS
ncbi:unnamed protein product, partial [Prorocentrum cordatum]